MSGNSSSNTGSANGNDSVNVNFDAANGTNSVNALELDLAVRRHVLARLHEWNQVGRTHPHER